MPETHRWNTAGVLAPLDGFTVGVTADRRAGEQVELLERRGARAVLAPTIRTLPLAHDVGLREATEALIAEPPDIVVVTTGLGIRGWFAAAEAMGLGSPLVAALAGAEVLTRGPKAAGAAVTVGLEVTWLGRSERSEELVDHLAARDLSGARVAVQLDGRDQPVLADAIAGLGRGVVVVGVPVYRWTLPVDPEPALRLVEATCEGRVDAVTFTAGPAARNLFTLADGTGRGEELRAALDERVLAMCVGPVCADALADLGVSTAVRPERPRLGSMVQALAEHFAPRRTSLVLEGTDVVVQGSTAAIGGERVALTDRDRDLLAVLAERPGAVVSKATLLRRVWGAGEADEHVVEVAVARLRRRLGRAGPALETSIRRGYRLVASEPGTGDVVPTSTMPSTTRTS
jgi:uroporphyrinogen-III synthase